MAKQFVTKYGWPLIAVVALLTVLVGVLARPHVFGDGPDDCRVVFGQMPDVVCVGDEVTITATIQGTGGEGCPIVIKANGQTLENGVFTAAQPGVVTLTAETQGENCNCESATATLLVTDGAAGPCRVSHKDTGNQPTVNKTAGETTHKEWQGETFQAVCNAIGTQHVGITELVMPNENAIVFTTQTQFQQLDCATCATITITNVTITYSIKFTLPKWSNYDNATPQDQALWDSFYARVVEHENGHAAIIDDFMKALANRLMGLSATCCDENQQGALTRANAALNEALNSTKTAIGDELQAANDKYHEKVGTVIPCFQENDND